MLTKFKIEMIKILKGNMLMMAILTVFFLTACQREELPPKEELTEIPQEEELSDIRTKDSLDMHINFAMTIEDIFTIKDVGVAVTGIPSEGSVDEGKNATIFQNGEDGITSYDCMIVKIEHIDGEEGKACAGQNVGLILEGISAEDIKVGDVIETFVFY